MHVDGVLAVTLHRIKRFGFLAGWLASGTVVVLLFWRKEPKLLGCSLLT